MAKEGMLSRGQEVFHLNEILHLQGGMDPWSELQGVEKEGWQRILFLNTFLFFKL